MNGKEDGEKLFETPLGCPYGDREKSRHADFVYY
jgi:hypothetical protein